MICINNNAVTNNNYGKLRDHISLLKSPMGMQKNVFKIYREFGHAASKWLAHPGLGCMTLDL